MKKLLIVGAFVMSFGVAVAGPKININTPVEWATSVIKAALNQAGLIGSSDANWDVRVTHDRILAALLEKKTFSLKQATEVCLGQCNKSDFLKNGKGASGKKCPDICKSFSDALLAENNKAAKSSTGGKGTAGNTSQKPKTNEEAYSERLKKNGYCKEVYTGDADDVTDAVCKKAARRYAQGHACKLKTYVSQTYNDVHIDFNGGFHAPGDCFANSFKTGKFDPQYSPVLQKNWDENFMVCYGNPSITNYEYAPSYKDCVATFNEKTCNDVAQGRYK